MIKNDARYVTCNTCHNVLSYEGLVEDYEKTSALRAGSHASLSYIKPAIDYLDQRVLK